jgi:sec-independent protein translocase protein TatB
MFDIGFGEIFLIAIVALLVLGPERLPKAARFTGLWVRRARAQWYSVKAELENELADDELRRSLKQTQADLLEARDSLAQSGAALKQQVEQTGAEVRDAFRPGMDTDSGGIDSGAADEERPLGSVTDELEQTELFDDLDADEDARAARALGMSDDERAAEAEHVPEEHPVRRDTASSDEARSYKAHPDEALSEGAAHPDDSAHDARRTDARR